MGYVESKEQALGVPLEDVLSHYGIPIKNHKFNCLWHEEKDASATIYPHTNTGSCFGCGKGFNPISLVMQVEQVGFKQALDILNNNFESSGRIIVENKRCCDRYFVINKELRQMIKQGKDIKVIMRYAQLMDIFCHDAKILLALYRGLARQLYEKERV